MYSFFCYRIAGNFRGVLIFVNFVVYVTFIYKNQIIYMVHTLFLIDSRIFYPTKITRYTVLWPKYSSAQ